ncbi:hypothetical protein LTR53_012274 [Teratosphaeriaceae sp. CCFEE 6253]|nr:hypothetical protein LTR53_012274 [Teratosphaeriaceae sp. CCFEE 6253]
MADPLAAADWPLKNITTAALVNPDQQGGGQSAYRQHDGAIEKNMTVPKPFIDRLLRYTIGAFILSMVSLILSIVITARFGVKHAHLLVAWITVSGGVTWLLGAMLFCLLRRKSGAVQDVTGPDSTELIGKSKSEQCVARHCNAAHASADGPNPAPSTPASTASCLLPLTHFSRQDGESKHSLRTFRNDLRLASRTGIAITPLKRADRTTVAHEMPFESHPHPLTSSPVFDETSPSFPPQALSRATHYLRSSSGYGYASGSLGSKMFAGSRESNGPYGMPLRSASRMDVPASFAHDVDMGVARLPTAKKTTGRNGRHGGV